MAFAEEPELEYEEIIQDELGKFYEIYAKLQLVGAYLEKGEVCVLVRITEPIIHEDVEEEAYSGFYKEILKRILPHVPELKRVKIIFQENEESFEYVYEE